MVTTKPKTNKDLRDAMIARLDEKYDLVYVAYDDKLSDKQVAAIVSGDTTALWDDTEEWESESKWRAVKAITEELTTDIIREWENEDSNADFTSLADDFYGSDEWEQVRDAIEERNSGDWVKELANNTGRVLLRIPAANLTEDDRFSFRDVQPAEVLDAIGFAHTPHNLSEVDYMLAECSPEFSVLMGYWIVGADVSDLWELRADGGAVTLTNPYLYMGNPSSGTGFITEKALEGTVCVAREDLRSDKGAFGYSVNEIFGGLSPSSFEAEITPCEGKHPKADDTHDITEWPRGRCDECGARCDDDTGECTVDTTHVTVQPGTPKETS